MSEKDLMDAVCSYLRKRDYLFYGDFAAGMRLTLYQSQLIRRYRSGTGLPDIIVFHRTEQYVGFAFELKRNKDEVYRKDGTLKSNDHIIEQACVLSRLRKMGWFADFIWDIEQIKQIL